MPAAAAFRCSSTRSAVREHHSGQQHGAATLPAITNASIVQRAPTRTALWWNPERSRQVHQRELHSFTWFCTVRRTTYCIDACWSVRFDAGVLCVVDIRVADSKLPIGVARLSGVPLCDRSRVTVPYALGRDRGLQDVLVLSVRSKVVQHPQQPALKLRIHPLKSAGVSVPSKF